MTKKKWIRPSMRERAACKADYQHIAMEVIGALMQAERNAQVEIGFCYVLRFPEDFPKGSIARKTKQLLVRRMNSRKVLDWLYKNGYSTFNTSMLLTKRSSATSNISSTLAALTIDMVR